MRKKQAAFTAGLTLTMIGVILLVSLPLTSISTQTSAAPSSTTTSTCSTPMPASSQPQTADVYQITPGSTASICVDYEFQTSGAYSVAPANFGPLSVSSGGYSYEACGAANGTKILTCPGLNITPSPAKFDHQAGDVIEVSFTVQATGNAGDLYLLFVANCDPIILASGPVPASVPNIVPSCVSSVDSPPPNVIISGVANINVVVVPSI